MQRSRGTAFDGSTYQVCYAHKLKEPRLSGSEMGKMQAHPAFHVRLGQFPNDLDSPTPSVPCGPVTSGSTDDASISST